ncbi:FAD-binding oxidoreductase [Crenobacter caeni]|uniref:FAD-binding oxidoreductase n=1 Tax=Crenobacter caeni TaxID=2705474 RepID=A0A6B2KQ78_9NEIS|nr:FAD-binding oxidoreductase [Crenobacter caeni]NDV12308.1 FAD-binding oxidoreductase [Crenobacter caeni]
MSTMPPLPALLADAPALRIVTDDASRAKYGLDWTRYWQPDTPAVLFPTTVDEVVAIVRWARRHKVALVPSGGRTGLSGGAVAAGGEVVVSFERMNRIGRFDALDGIVEVEPGVVTRTLQAFAREHGMHYPVDFASSGSSQIGGNIATNAGGIKVLRYGMTRDWVAGLTVVTGAGEVLELNRGLVKNNTGYDLRHLFVGSEGTLGFIVGASIRLTQAPPETAVMVLALPDLSCVMRVFDAFRRALTLHAFEFFSDKALKHVLARGAVRPFESAAPYYVLLEYVRPAGGAEPDLVVFGHCAEQGWVVDGVVSQSDAHARALWRLREDISEAITPHTPYKNDIALRISEVDPFVARLDALLGEAYPDFEVVWFGHIGDGNLHINVLRPSGMDLAAFRQACEHVNEAVFELVREAGGSVSAEHGVGLFKRDYLSYTCSPEEIALMRGIKQLFDPDGVMNPGKLLA